MSLTTNQDDEDLRKIRPDGQQEKYLVLSDEERAKGFVRPVRVEYIHVGVRPSGTLVELTAEQHEQYDKFGYVKYETYAEPRGSVVGRFWTDKQLNSGCQTKTAMGQALAETYARDPQFYSGTFCCHCGGHFPVGEFGEFEWLDGSKVGT